MSTTLFPALVFILGRKFSLMERKYFQRWNIVKEAFEMVSDGKIIGKWQVAALSTIQ